MLCIQRYTAYLAFFLTMDALDFISNIIRSRRSVKTAQFKAGDKIPDEVIRQALENASWAPTHGRTEPWHFIVYTGDAIQRLSDFQAELYKTESGEGFTEAKYRKLKEGYRSASHVIAICHKRSPGTRIPDLEEVAAVSAAVQNMALTIHAAGYGGYWTTGGVTYYASAKPFFGLEQEDRLLGFYLAGVVAEAPQAPSRRPLAEKTTWLDS